MATKAQVKSFIEKIAPIVVEIHKSKSRKVLPSICIAQACYESAYGTADKMVKANALFGIKVGKNKVKYGSAWKGKAYSTKTKEFYNSNSATVITDMFRAYASIEDSISDYFDLLAGCSRYANAINNSNLETSVKTIANSYATDPKYAETVLKIIKTNDLTKYDKEAQNIVKESNTAAASINKKLNHEVGEKIMVSSYYKTSESPITEAIIKTKNGTILKVAPDKRNPYCFGTSTGTVIGWCNDGDIRIGAGSSSSATIKSLYYTVKSGDTLAKIAKKYDTKPATIVSLNKNVYPNIKTNFIRVGWKLLVKK